MSNGWLVEGEKDPNLNRWVVDLIIQEGTLNSTSPFFAVYLDEELAIQWYCLRQVSENFPADFSTILNDIVHLETLSQALRRVPVRKWHLTKLGAGKPEEYDHGREINANERDFSRMKRRHPQLRATRRLLGEALARTYGPAPQNLKDDNDPRSTAAKAALETATAYLKARSSDLGRAFVINGALLAALLCLLVAIVYGNIYASSKDGILDQIRIEETALQSFPRADQGEENSSAIKSRVSNALNLTNAGVSQEQWDLMRYSLIGAAGAMLSVLTSTYKRDYDAGAGRPVFMLEGATRIVVGVLGSLLITLAIKAGFFLPFLSKTVATAADGTKSNIASWMPLFFGFLSGASERLVPSFIQVVETQVQSNDKT